jgi:formylglycine-generating enzyme required for sulfatase activity
MPDHPMHRLAALWYRLEHLPAWPMGLAGLAVGTGLGAWSLFGLGGLAGVLGAGGVLLVAAGLGLGSRPVADPLPETAQDAAQEPTPVAPPSLLDMVPIPPGESLMGSGDDDPQAYQDEKPQHRVQVEGFLMARTAVTRDQYREVMGTVPEEWKEDEPGDLPANWVSWNDAVDFCNRLSEREGFTLCYRKEDAGVEVDPAADGYRLPTEMEWEYACRAGTTTPWFFGASDDKAGDYAWYDENSQGSPHPVCGKKANSFGLHDMAGNVWEWCWDCWHDDYSAWVETPNGGLVVNSLTNERCDRRVLRGGSFLNSARFLRSALRDRVDAVSRYSFLGFRCVRVPARQPFDPLSF